MDLFNLTTESQLNTFIASRVQPTEAFLVTCREAVDRLVRFLQNEAPSKLRPNRVIKGGSLGKGTAVIGKSDVDLTLMMLNYSNVRELVGELDSLLELLERCLVRYPGVRVVNRNPFCVQVEVTCSNGHVIPADVLIALDLLHMEPSRDKIYKKMAEENPVVLNYYSASFIPHTVDLLSRLPTKLKSLIRLIKFWKKQTMTDETVRWPKSYGFEMVTLYAWMQARQPTKFNMTRALRAVLTYLVNHRNFRADFGPFKYYSREFLHPPPSGPYIMDPIDPTNDLYSRKGWDWGQTAAMARKWLQAPLFRQLADDQIDCWESNRLC